VTFPVYLPIAGRLVHPHILFEACGYAAALAFFVAMRRRRGDSIQAPIRASVVAAALVGGAIGSKVLYWAEDPASTMAQWRDPAYLTGGKTIVGGLLGGWLAVEGMKRLATVSVATGDLLAAPICVGIAIGRLGCFLTGLADRTYGSETSLPWGVDFGDGVRRHPTQIYEMLLLLGMAMALTRLTPGGGRLLPEAWRTGDTFKLIMAVYMALRLCLDFIKPVAPTLLGLQAIQWAALAGLLGVVWSRRTPTAALVAQETRSGP
jgi:phosphatidylglycerol---prolipoprotein diacylglyceryl transferase